MEHSKMIETILIECLKFAIFGAYIALLLKCSVKVPRKKNNRDNHDKSSQ